MRKLLLPLVLLISLISSPLAAQEKPKEEPKVEMHRYYLVILRRGPSWTAERTPETIAVGQGHMANIRRLAAEGKLVIAGPFLDQTGPGSPAWLFIFRVDSIDEARALTESDPAVQAGRFTYEVLPWLGPKTLGY